MTDETGKNLDEADLRNKPDWIAKAPQQQREGERLERVGVAWNREDGGIGLRLVGTQLISSDIYLYPNESES